MAPPRLYLDWNATAPLHPAARDAILRASTCSAIRTRVHGEGRAVRAAIEGARRKVAALDRRRCRHM